MEQDGITVRAVARQYRDLDDEARDIDAIARDFLGKIIQLSVALPRPSNIQDYVRGHLFSTVDADAVELLRKQPEYQLLEERHDEFLEDVLDEEDAVEIGASTGDAHDSERAPASPMVNMAETPRDCARFERWSMAFGFDNPRQLLRLRNTNRLLLQLNHSAPFPEDDEVLLVMLFWLEHLNQVDRPERDMYEQCLQAASSDEDSKRISDRITSIGVRSVLCRGPEDEYSRVKHYVKPFCTPNG